MDIEDKSLGSTEVQVIYKLGSLEALVSNSMRRIDDQIAALRTEASANHADQAAATAKLEIRLSKVEEWKTASTAKISVVVAVVTVVWVFLAPTIRHIFGIGG